MFFSLAGGNSIETLFGAGSDDDFGATLAGMIFADDDQRANLNIPDMSKAERKAALDAVFGLLPQMGYGMDFNNQQTPMFNNYQGMTSAPMYQGSGQSSGMLGNAASIGQQQIAQGQIMNPTIAKSISK
jgi:hypothetical protein